MEQKKYNTGLQDLDALLNSNSEPSMIMDKAVFDASILPLLIDTSLDLTDDLRYEHIKTVWGNYYKAITDNADTGVFGSKDKPVFVPTHGLYMSIQIVNEKGVVVDTTPPLVRPAMYKNGGAELLAYERGSKINPPVATENFRNGQSFYVEGDLGKEWANFIARYTNSDSKLSENYKSSADTSSDRIIEG